MKTFKEFLTEQTYYGTSASGGIIVANDTKKILFLKRSEDEDSEQLQWEMCVGGSSDAEDLDAKATFVREAAEEIGVSQDMLFGGGLTEIFVDFGENFKPFKYHVFHFYTLSEFNPILSDEHVDFKWVDITNINDIPHPLHFGTERLLKNPNVLGLVKEK